MLTIDLRNLYTLEPKECREFARQFYEEFRGDFQAMKEYYALKEECLTFYIEIGTAMHDAHEQFNLTRALLR